MSERREGFEKEAGCPYIEEPGYSPEKLVSIRFNYRGLPLL